MRHAIEHVEATSGTISLLSVTNDISLTGTKIDKMRGIVFLFPEAILGLVGVFNVFEP